MVGTAVGATVGIIEGIAVGIVLGMGRGLAVAPLPGSTVMSAQFQNCSPQPKWPLGPAGPLQPPEKAVHQAAFSGGAQYPLA